MTDLASLVFTLTASADTKLPPMPTRIIHGSFLRWLERDHPQLVTLLHDNNERRPYTLSDLHGKFEERNGWLKIPQGETYWYRLTGMHADFIQCVVTSLRQQEHGPQPDDPKLVPGPAFVLPQEHHWAQLSSFSQIIETVRQQSERRELSNTVTLRFESPTCFIENKQALPLPVPRYVFGYLANKWQLASPAALPVEDLQHFVESIFLSQARIETRLVDMQKYKRTGFVGECHFALHPALPENYRQALHLLAELAFFSGVGSHTTMGLGQVRQKR
ncbi:CRISPR system precrRNA processing endoribonuclease RAMP protein Cas6 [candidate division KSB1 bacterium]|nr:CRISPR system precrRNA processing endoribonuclease RAMP protein Cas6 [candidate division KSB1 bacterium]